MTYMVKTYVVCGAKTRGGTTCARRPSLGRNRCKLHGGASPRGNHHWNWQGKGQSREMRRREAAGLKRVRDLVKTAKAIGLIR